MHSRVVVDAAMLRRVAARQAALEERVTELAAEREEQACVMGALRETASHEVADRAIDSARWQTLVSCMDALACEVEELREDILDLEDELAEHAEKLRALVPSSRSVEVVSSPAPNATAGSRRLHADEYRSLIGRLRQVVCQTLPPDARVLVVSRGDDELLRLDDRAAQHFPQGERGLYAGHYPADSAAAVAHLESLREAGAQFLVFPGTALWWLDHYKDFRRHLEAHYRVVANEPATCLIFALLDGRQSGVAPAAEARVLRYRALVGQVRDVVRSVLPATATVIVVSHGDPELLRLDGRKAWHFPQSEDGSYAGYAPADSSDAITLLEVLRERGGEYLLFPRTEFWWLDYYRGLREHLDRRGRLVVRQPHVCSIYALMPARRASGATASPGSTRYDELPSLNMHEVT
jgi:hypothetical protein